MSLPGLQKVKNAEGKTAVVTNAEAGSNGESQKAFFDIRGAGNWAGDWINTVKRDLEKRFGKVEVTKTESGNSSERPFKSLGKSLEQVHPLRAMNEQVKGQIKSLAKENSGKIAGVLVEAGIYCAIFHHLKANLKRVTKHRKYAGPTVRYVSDVMMPNGLYGPIFGFLIRLTLPF